jgi:hypothetical protein
MQELLVRAADAAWVTLFAASHCSSMSAEEALAEEALAATDFSAAWRNIT